MVQLAGVIGGADIGRISGFGIKYDPEAAKAELKSYMDEKGIKDPGKSV